MSTATAEPINLHGSKKKKVKQLVFQDSKANHFDSPQSDNMSTKSIDLLKNISSHKNVLDSDEAASQTSRSTGTDITEIRALNRHEDSLTKEFQDKMKELRAKFDAKVEAYSTMYSNKVQHSMSRTLSSLNSQDLTETPGWRKPKRFNEKNFTYEETLLNTLFEQNENIRTLYNIAIASMAILFVNFCLSEYNKSGAFFDYQTIGQVFNKPDVVFNIWIRLFLGNMLIIPFTRWVHFHRPAGILWVSLYLMGQVFNYYYSYQVTVAHGLGFASSMIVLCEATRMSLKSHSYLRNKLMYGSDIWQKYRAFETGPKSNDSNESHIYIPPIKFNRLAKEIQSYLYFHFAPTLLYRDKYIRAPKTNYKKVAFHFFNVFLCIYYGFILYKAFIVEQFQNTGKNPGTVMEFLLSIFSSVLPGMTVMFMMFFGLLHSWFCAFAELLRFPDRLFYEDWWTSLEFGTYYRKWNIVVHEWLYYYVYVDFRRFTNGKLSRTAAQLSTFLLSAVVHEVILAGALGFFYPILFIIFTGPGILFIRGTRNIKNQSMNILFWFLMFLGTGIIFVLYAREYYARKDGTVNPDSWGYWYYLAPRSLLVYLEKNSQ